MEQSEGIIYLITCRKYWFIFLAAFEKTVILPSISNFMDTPPPSITEMEIDDTEATFSPFTFEEIKTFDQPWLEILDMDEFNSIVTDKSEVATLGDIPEHNIDTPADDSTRSGVTMSKLVACTVCKKNAVLTIWFLFTN